jgi:hypothetical protein
MITRWPPDVTRHADQDHQPTQAGLKRKLRMHTPIEYEMLYVNPTAVA